MGGAALRTKRLSPNGTSYSFSRSTNRDANTIKEIRLSKDISHLDLNSRAHLHVRNGLLSASPGIPVQTLTLMTHVKGRRAMFRLAHLAGECVGRTPLRKNGTEPTRLSRSAPRELLSETFH